MPVERASGADGLLAGIILAAGASSRMGVPKATLPIGDEGDTFLTRLAGNYRSAGIGAVVVVVGPETGAVRAAAEAIVPKVTVALNPDPSRGQLSSLIAALDALDVLPGRQADAAIVTPVDVPLVRVETIARLIDRWRGARPPVVRPVRGGRHGHPVLFDRGLFAELRSADCARGARVVVHAHATEVLDVAVEDEGAFIDIDTRDDYERYVGRWPG